MKSLSLVLLVLASPLAAQQSTAGGRLWSMAFSAGTAFGGPSSQMGHHLVAEGWTDQGCTPKGTDCHTNPVVARPQLQFATAVNRRFGSRFEAQGIVEVADLGAAGGKLDNTEVQASWGVQTMAALLLFKPVHFLRLGGGPLVARLRGDTPGGLSTTVWRGGFVLESGVRASVGPPLFINVSAAYRRIGERTEGPWPTRRFSSVGGGGPSPLALDYSHFSLGLGFGVWF